MQKWKLEKDMDGEVVVEVESRGTEKEREDERARELNRLTGRLGWGGCDYAWIGKAQSGDQARVPSNAGQ
jgi:hypothetical protein